MKTIILWVLDPLQEFSTFNLKDISGGRSVVWRMVPQPLIWAELQVLMKSKLPLTPHFKKLMMKAVEGHNSKMVVLVEYTTVVMEHHYFRIFFYIILFSVTSINCWSQNFTNYYNDRNEAIHNYYEGKLEKADSLLTVAFKKLNR